jgi:hypothetical protein
MCCCCKCKCKGEVKIDDLLKDKLLNDPIVNESGWYDIANAAPELGERVKIKMPGFAHQTYEVIYQPMAKYLGDKNVDISYFTSNGRTIHANLWARIG